MSTTDIRSQFPFFKAHPELIYFDNAATTLKPQSVIDVTVKYLSESSVNIGRGKYDLADMVMHQVESVREKVASFIHAPQKENIIFTSGVTQSIKDFVFLFGLQNLKDGDQILYSPLDHASTVDFWFEIKKLLSKQGIQIVLVPYSLRPTGDSDIQNILSLVTEKTRFVILTHIHNIFGTDTDVEELRKQLREDILILLDASQSISHIPIDMKTLGVDMICFSSHKMFADTGVGVLALSQRLQKTIPWKNFFEKGTLNISGILSLGAAIDFIHSVSLSFIYKTIADLTQYLLSQLREMPTIQFLPGMGFCACKEGYGILSFRVEGIPSEDIGFALNAHGIMVRTGSHCMNTEMIYSDSVRVSLHVYNTREEIDTFIGVLKSFLK
jgi:cysteine desulfurase/selenocysteine lyase